MPDDLYRLLHDVWNYSIVKVDGAWVTPGQIVIALAAFFVGLLISRLLSRVVVARLFHGLHVSEGASGVLSTLIHYCVVAVMILVALQVAGVPLAAFTIFGGALALGVGFGTQHILNNVISGLIIIIERPVKTGDLVQVDGRLGIVVRINARATMLTDYRGVTHLIPNSKFIESTVTNWHYTNEIVCATIQVGVAYGSDTALVGRLLRETAAANPKVSSDPCPRVLFTDFASDALAFELLVWMRARKVIERREVESELRFAIDQAFRAAGIAIAFPQRDIHLDTVRPLQIEVTRAPASPRTEPR